MTELPHDPLWPRVDTWLTPGSGNADFAVIGMPTWRTSLSATGAAATPAAVRQALRRYSPFAGPTGAHLEGVDLTVLQAIDAGDAVDPDLDEDAAVAFVAAVSARLSVVIGGDNSATVPAALGSWGADITTAGLITLDAHHDIREGRSNGSPVRRLIELGLDGRRVVQIGISDFANSAEYSRRARDYGITVITRNELRRRTIEDAVDEALAIAGSAGGPIHVDLDVDVCDRSAAPGCPASVPGGISADELRRATRRLASHPAVRSIDLTEVDATADTPDARTIRLTALCVLEAAAGLATRATN